MPEAQTPPAAIRGARKVREGIVTSDKMHKTIVVRVSNLVRHPRYSRVIHQTNSFKAHDEQNKATIGDRVKIMETRPLSKDKRWRLIEILKQASTACLWRETFRLAACKLPIKTRLVSRKEEV